MGTCYNGGQCQGGGYPSQCACPPGFQGPRCQYGKTRPPFRQGTTVSQLSRVFAVSAVRSPSVRPTVKASEAPRFRIAGFCRTADRVFPHRAFPQRAFQHRIVQKVNFRHILLLTQQIINFCLAAAAVKRTWRPPQPVGQTYIRICFRSVMSHDTPARRTTPPPPALPRHPRPPYHANACHFLQPF